MALSKLVAGRDKDLHYVGMLMREKMAASSVLHERIETLPLLPDQLAIVRARLRKAAADPNSSRPF